MKGFSSSRLSFKNFILQSIKPFPRQITGLLFTACYWALHVSLQPYIIKLILDHVSLNPSTSHIAIPIGGYIFLSFAFTLNFRLHEYICLQFYPQLKANIMATATKKISYYPYSFFQNQFSGKLTDRIKSLSKGTVEIVQLLLDRIFSHTLALFVAFFTLMTINARLAWLFFAWALLMILLSSLATKKARLLSHQLSGANSHVIGMIVDCFTNILNVRLFTAYQYEEALLNKQLQETIQHDKSLRWYLIKLMAVQGITTAAMVSICLLILMFSVSSQRLTVGDFALVLTLTLSFSDIISNFAQDVSHFSEVYGMVTQGLSILHHQIEIKDSPQAKPLVIEQGEISFQKVHFRYPNAEPLFSNKSITIYAGQKVGLVGYSGSGKSTFVSLILRLFDVSSGKIVIDQQDIKSVTQASLHQAIGLIPQEPTLFNRSLLDNIRYGRPEATLEEIITAATKAHAHEFIEALPEGYNTLVGERGIKLSGGQRQRIAIARVILKDAPILLLDEATSALDSVTENAIKDTLIELMRGKTTIVIAHRLSTLLNMDRILVFNQGKIVEDGNHYELLEKRGHYERLWNAQVGGFIPD